MNATLTISEIIHQKKATEEAITKLLHELKEQTGCMVNGITTTKIIGAKTDMIFVNIDLAL